MNVVIYTDGGARGNPGPAGAGVCITDARTDEAIFEAGFFLGKATNNVAEYTGLIRGLEKAAQLNAKQVEVVSDSELMVRQVNGEYKVRAATLVPLYRQALTLLGQFDKWKVGHVYREGNRRADQLANAAMDAGTDIDYSG